MLYKKNFTKNKIQKHLLKNILQQYFLYQSDYMTKILEIKNKNIDYKKISVAANAIKKGKLVVFPTETVYGLGANAFDDAAIRKIFIAKGRPSDNPLIVHIANMKDLKNITKTIPETAKILINSFWPGPLTLVLHKHEEIPYTVTARLESVAVRMPSNKIALTLIKMSGVPIAAPSANISGRPSPTSAKHVIEDLFGKVDIIIDAENSKLGLESTVIDLTCKTPTLLRPGAITIEQLRKKLGKVNIHPGIYKKIVTEHKVKSPGMKHKHYAPKTKLILVESKQNCFEKVINKIIAKTKNKKIGVITIARNRRYPVQINKYIGSTKKSIAKNIFHTLIELDKRNLDLIITEGTDEKDLGLAIMNRLRRAATKIIKT